MGGEDTILEGNWEKGEDLPIPPKDEMAMGEPPCGMVVKEPLQVEDGAIVRSLHEILPFPPQVRGVILDIKTRDHLIKTILLANLLLWF